MRVSIPSGPGPYRGRGFDPWGVSIPDDAGFRSRWVSNPPSPGCRGFDPGSSSDPDNRPRVEGGVLGFRSHRVLGFDPDDCWSRVSIPTTPGFRSLMNRVRTLGVSIPPSTGFRSLMSRVRTLEGGSIPDFPSKLTSKLLVRSLVSLLVSY